MKKIWTQTTKTGALITTILLLSAALLIQAQSQISPSDQSHLPRQYQQDPAADQALYTGDEYDWVPAYGGPASSLNESTPASAEKVSADDASEKVADAKAAEDLAQANGLVTTLARIIRSGKKMRLLRSTKNPALERQCFELMTILRNQTQEVAARRRNIILQANAKSLGTIFSNVMKCVRCDTQAEQYCALAQQDLNEINRSLSLD